jgi:hypothetical protein
MIEYAKKAFILVACVAIGFTAYTLFSGYSDGAGTKDITAKLATLERNQQLLTTLLDGISKDLAKSQRRVEAIEIRIGNAEAGVSEVTGRLADSQTKLTESAGLISENERIIREILKRNEGKSK